MVLSGRVALVTGASRGIGRAIALELARAGASVIINYKKEKNSAELVVDLIKSEGGYAAALQGDVSSYSEAAAMIDRIVEQFGKIDILVNNAGISKVGLFLDAEEEDWDSIMGTNLKGVFNLTHNAIKPMLALKQGCIVNISSIWGNSGASCEVIYSAAKGGVNSFTKALAKEVAPSNIRVNAVAPGVINTEMNRWLSEDDLEELKGEIPMGRLGEGSDIGKTVVFLCSEASQYITGQIITVDGGFL